MNILAMVLIVLAIVFAVLGAIMNQPRLEAVAVVCLAVAVALQTYPSLTR